MDLNEVVLLISTAYIIIVQFLGINFVLGLVLRNRKLDAQKRTLYLILIVVAVILLGPIPFLLAGAYTIAYNQTKRQQRKQR